MLTLLLVCSFSPRVHSIQRGPRILLRRNHSSETTKNPTKFVGFLWRRKRDSFLSFARQPWSAVFMLCKSLRAAAKNDALCRFLNALVRIPLIKYRKTKRTSVFACPFCWRRKRDSNPRGLSPKRFSRPPRYDRFDTSPCVNSNLGNSRNHLSFWLVSFAFLSLSLSDIRYYISSVSECQPLF